MDFTQFGPYAITFVIGAAIVIFLIKQLAQERKRADDATTGRLQDAKDSRDAIIEPLNQAVSTTKLIYDLLTNNSSRRN
jgi:hypothetical protein